MYLVVIWEEARTGLGVVAQRPIPDPGWIKIALIQLVASKYSSQRYPDSVMMLLFVLLY
jgi:hypothetical protein